MASCDSQPGKSEYKEAKQTLSKNATQGVVQFERLLKVYPRSEYSMKAALEMMDFCSKSKACQESEILFLQYILDNNKDSDVQLLVLERISEVYFERGYYQQAIGTINQLLTKSKGDSYLDERLQLAKSYFYLRSFYQAEVELKAYIEKSTTETRKVDGLMLKAEILGAQKKYTEAVATYKEIKTEHNEIYLKNQVFINEALMFEEQKQIDLAIGTLEDVKEKVLSADFLQLKIQKLKERKALMPGASGLKK